MTACYRGHAIIELLIRSGANLDSYTALALVNRLSNSRTLSSQTEQIVFQIDIHLWITSLHVSGIFLTLLK